ncbi:YihY/virulence factor BrkB family protein [Spirosoma rhododendri]|uniref:YihY/virulence factor BrkB family protein n=1 Tax=Spirosoma rhododendri TaxID=2728024 RepID=A0A7L5DUY8_9BACT|nr:YihY/virulence factor BrkB family protein [Spirosoma rhododendri]QJD80408.1 YihY/virulence factor BrkB family protein [Spirosoma rhododendri]
MKQLRSFGQIAGRAFTNLAENDPIRMAAATAFFSFFALPPIVIILTQLYGQVLADADRQISTELFRTMADLFGWQSARQLQDISQRLQQPRANGWLTALSVALLLLASTTLFAIIKNSLNQLWQVKHAAHRRWWASAADRAIAFGLILFTGLLVLGSFLVQQMLMPLKTQLASSFPPPFWLMATGRFLLSTVLLTLWLCVLFKYLPDIKIRWQAVWRGALVTALLFGVGEQILDRLLIKSPVGALYGRSGAIILILLFIFYSALILYYGASFTREYASWLHLDAQPASDAVAYQIQELPGDNDLSDNLTPAPLLNRRGVTSRESACGQYIV